MAANFAAAFDSKNGFLLRCFSGPWNLGALRQAAAVLAKLLVQTCTPTAAVPLGGINFMTQPAYFYVSFPKMSASALENEKLAMWQHRISENGHNFMKLLRRHQKPLKIYATAPATAQHTPGTCRGNDVVAAASQPNHHRRTRIHFAFIICLQLQRHRLIFPFALSD